MTVGAVPGQLRAKSGSSQGKIRVIEYDAKNHSDNFVDSVDELAGLTDHLVKRPLSGAPQSATQTDLAHAANQDNTQVAWVNVDGLGDIKMLKALGKLYGIHPLALEDVVNVHQHAKLECYGETLFFVARMPIADNGFETEQISLFLVDGVVITLQERPGDCLDPVRHRIANRLGRIRKRDSDYLLYSIIDAIVDSYFPLLEGYSLELDRISDSLYEHANRNLPLHLHDIRADLLLIRKVVNQHRNALNEVLREAGDVVSEDTLLYFRDCQDHIQQLIEAADTDRETCGELRELYFAMLSEKNNDVMKVLTIIATIFIPMSFVAGIYGMNFDSEASVMNMPELHWAFGYPFALGLMAVMAGGLLAYLYRKGWLSA
ncbi:MAG: magnesium/cobalt transporter CorA [Pirellulaceae bacterium]|nr:magnesium/cobalt transporter CorA [Pirellulaceae bacterium]